MPKNIVTGAWGPDNISKKLVHAWAMGGRICDLAYRHHTAIAEAIDETDTLPVWFLRAREQVRANA